ncbi:MAG: acyl carrier protein [Acidimicrobiales bacterium]
MTDEIRRVVAQHGRLSVPMSQVADDDDLYFAGMTSHASVSMLIALEEAFGLEFPEEMLRQSTFQSVNSIAAALDVLIEDKKAAELGPRT